MIAATWRHFDYPGTTREDFVRFHIGSQGELGVAQIGQADLNKPIKEGENAVLEVRFNPADSFHDVGTFAFGQAKRIGDLHYMHFCGVHYPGDEYPGKAEFENRAAELEKMVSRTHRKRRSMMEQNEGLDPDKYIAERMEGLELQQEALQDEFDKGAISETEYEKEKAKIDFLIAELKERNQQDFDKEHGEHYARKN